MDTLFNRVKNLSETQPDKAAVCFKKECLTYKELFDVAYSMSVQLKEEGIKPGDRVAYSAISKPETVAMYLALNMTGAVSVFLDKNSTPEGMKNVYDEADAVVLYTEKPMRQYAEGVNLKSLRALFMDAQENSRTSLDELRNPEEEEISEILFTTGTTSKPKGVMLSYRAVYNILSNTILGTGVQEEDKVLLPLPLNHSFALRVLRAVLYKGATLVLQNGFTFAKEVENNINTFGCTAMAAVPASYEVMRSQMQGAFSGVLENLRYIEFGAGSLSPRQRKEITELLPGVQIFNTWGSSESGGAIFCNVNEVVNDPEKISALGRPISGRVQVRALNAEGETVRGDITSPGRMSIKGDMIMSGYWKNDELSRETLKEGWLLTSDLIYTDDEGYVYMLGRADDIINVGGEKVSPLEVEAVACQYEGIMECACIGVEDPDDLLGQIPVLFITANSSYNENEFIKFLSGSFEKYKVPKKFIPVEEIPKNRMQKIDRNELRRMWENQSDMDLMNPVMQCILSRRSIRRFTDKDIPANILEMILKAGYQAPTGHNMQSWKFTVLTKQEDIERLKEAARIAAEANKVNFYGFENPKVLILVSNDDRNHNGCQDCSCAAENMMLAAASYGIGSVWLNPLRTLRHKSPVEEVLDSFNVPANHTVWASIALGYATHQGQQIKRKTDVIEYI